MPHLPDLPKGKRTGKAVTPRPPAVKPPKRASTRSTQPAILRSIKPKLSTPSSKRGKTTGTPQPRPRRPKAPSKPSRGSIRLIVQSERSWVPSTKGPASGSKTPNRFLDRYRYPKGHKKAGQYAPGKAAATANVDRYTRDRKGERHLVEKSGRGKGKVTRTANIGRSFTDRAPTYSVTEAAQEAAAKGRRIFIKVGGRVIEVPASKANDAAALFTDLGSRMRSVQGRRVASAPLVGMELSYGATGILVNLDSLDYFDAEVQHELGSMPEDDELAHDLSGYVSRAVREYIGNDIDAEDILDAWGMGEDDDSDDDGKED